MGRFSGTVGALLFLGAVVRADVVTLTSMHDNTLIQRPDASGPLSNGAGFGMFVGRTNQGDGVSIRRGLMSFDLSGIAPGAQINSVSLTLFVRDGVNNAGMTIGMYRALAGWGEGASVSGDGAGAPAQPPEATWFYSRSATDWWTNPGGDFFGTASASASVTGSPSPSSSITYSGNGLVADMQAWIDGSEDNFGWLFKSDVETVGGMVRSFHTHESSSVALVPQLTIDFTPAPVPEPGSLALLGATAVGAAGCVLRRSRAVALRAGESLLRSTLLQRSS